MVLTSIAQLPGRRPGHPRYTQWVRDVEEIWLVPSEGVQHQPVELERLGSVSKKDWALVFDTGCDSFLTADRPLASQAPVIQQRRDFASFCRPRGPSGHRSSRG